MERSEREARIGTALRVVFALTVLALAPPSCNLVGGSCSCPSEPDPPSTWVQIEPAEHSPIVAVAADPPCGAQIQSMQNNSWITVSREKAGTCRVLVQIENGATYAVDVDFQAVDLGCCGGAIEAQPFPVISQTDAGIDVRD